MQYVVKQIPPELKTTYQLNIHRVHINDVKVYLSEVKKILEEYNKTYKTKIPEEYERFDRCDLIINKQCYATIETIHSFKTDAFSESILTDILSAAYSVQDSPIVLLKVKVEDDEPEYIHLFWGFVRVVGPVGEMSHFEPLEIAERKKADPEAEAEEGQEAPTE